MHPFFTKTTVRAPKEREKETRVAQVSGHHLPMFHLELSILRYSSLVTPIVCATHRVRAHNRVLGRGVELILELSRASDAVRWYRLVVGGFVRQLIGSGGTQSKQQRRWCKHVRGRQARPCERMRVTPGKNTNIRQKRKRKNTYKHTIEGFETRATPWSLKVKFSNPERERKLLPSLLLALFLPIYVALPWFLRYLRCLPPHPLNRMLEAWVA